MMNIPDEENNVTNSFEPKKGQRCTSSGDKCDSRCPFLVYELTEEEYQSYLEEYSKFIALAILNEFNHENNNQTGE